jgi:hypothetical protein
MSLRSAESLARRNLAAWRKATDGSADAGEWVEGDELVCHEI